MNLLLMKIDLHSCYTLLSVHVGFLLLLLLLFVLLVFHLH